MPFDPLPIAFGACLVVGGVLAALAHRRKLARMEEQAARGELEDWEIRFHRARHRRRLAVAGLLIWLGVAIPAGDAALAAGGAAARPWMAAYLAVLLTAVLGLLVLAALDWIASAIHTRDRLADVRAKQTALEYALREFRANQNAANAEPSTPARPRSIPRNRLRDYQFDD